MAQLFWRRFVNVLFWVFHNYLHLEKGMAPHLNKFESSSPKDALCQVWLKLAQLFWRRRFLIFVNVFLLFCNYIPLKKDVVLHLNKQESPSPKDALIQVCMVESGLMVLKRKMKMWKVDNNDEDNGRQTNCDQKKLTWTFGSGELIKNVKDLIRMHNFNPL